MRLIMTDEIKTESEDDPKEQNQYSSGQKQIEGYSEELRNLPVFDVKNDLIEKLKLHDTVILLGETGCGKTTQIPKYILEHDINKKGIVVVTQPRRIAAVSIAHRVADELKEECGKTVGYKIRFKTLTTGLQTVLIYATDGTLLREAVKDQLLLKYNVVILDEAHERTVTTDILFGVVQTAQELRKIQKLTPLKIIVMSAALDVDHFQAYFKNAPVFHIEGRHHQVDIFHTKDNIDDYYFTCLVTVFNIHAEAPASDDILVFLTGQEEIEKMAKDITMISRNPECVGPNLRVHTLYAAADPNRQLEVFQPAPHGTRKIIISTNIAETSVTIPGIKYVVDSGKVKMKFHNPVTGVNILKVQTISQEQALQRAGRAGRESDGFCYRAYSVEQFEKMSKSTVPEIHRCSLSSVTLTLLAMNKDPRTFNFIDKPEESAIKESMKELLDLRAISSLEDLTLTTCGERMSFLPLEPKFSRMLLFASDFCCLDEILDIIAMLSIDNIFVTSYSYDTRVEEIKRKYHSSTGDHVTLLNVFRNFNKAKSKEEWCRDNYVNFRALDFAKYIKIQLMSICNMFGIEMSSCGPEIDNVRKCLTTGLFKNIAVLQSDKSYCTAISKQRASIHPSSVLHKSLPYCVIFTELMESNELYMKNITVIDAEWLPQYVPDFAAKKNLYIVPENRVIM